LNCGALAEYQQATDRLPATNDIMLTVNGSARPAGTSSLQLPAIPDELAAEEAGPFMCVGVAVYK
jgi:hypothetical protein